MNIIAALDSANGIGKDGKLLCRIPSDLKRVKLLTLGKTIVMGYNTLVSLPRSAPLPDRRNIVLTSKHIDIPGADVCHGLDELNACLADTPSEDVFVFGGQSVYTQLLPECSRMYLTKINGVFGADAFFPPYDESEWKLVYKSETLCENGVSFNFTEYEKN